MSTPGLFRLVPTLFLTVIVVAAGAMVARGFAADEPWIKVASINQVRWKGVVYIDEHEIYLVRKDPGVIALSAKGPWEQKPELLRYCRSSGLFEGWWNGYFDREGRYYGGPAMRDMDRFAVKVEGPFVFVDMTQATRGRERGRGVQLVQRGAFCDTGPGTAPGA